MESFYDREEGVAWGPVTKQELLDDLLIYKPTKSKIRHRNTLNCNPSFMKDVEERFTDVTTANPTHQAVAVEINNDTVIISSDEEEYQVGDEEFVDEISREISNLNVCQTDLKTRLPTPANIDEDTFDESLNEEEEKLEESFNDIHSEKCLFESPKIIQNEAQVIQDISAKSDLEISCSCDTSSDELGTGQTASIQEDEVFNDTLSEIERLLNEGLNYTMGTDETSSQVFPDNRQSNNGDEKISRQILLDIPKIKLQPTIESPAITPSISSKNFQSVNATNKSCAKKKTKIPVAPTFALNKPTSKAFLTPTNFKNAVPNPSSVPINPKRRFKDIESPISLYIKNSAVAPLFKKITPTKQLNSYKGKAMHRQPEKCNKENSLVFPEVVYKPAKQTIIKSCDNNLKLPKNIESLIPQKPNIIKHEGHIGTKLNQSSISKKLREPDITINSTLDNTGDISVHCTKRAFITKNCFK